MNLNKYYNYTNVYITKVLIFAIVILGIHTRTKAHPHVFIETGITVFMTENSIDSLQIVFNFDRMISEELRTGFDKNKDNQFDVDEILEIQNKAFSNLVNYNYLIHIIHDNKELKIDTVYQFNAEYLDGVVSYNFSIYTDIDINNNQDKVKIAAYDHSYYMDVVIDEDLLDFLYPYELDIQYKVIEDRSQAYYYDQIYPQCVVLTINK